MYSEDDIIPLSALQHILFCERQCALIHIEQMWDENLFTAEGRIMHERVDEAGRESRKDVRIEFAMPLRSLRLGLVGKADVVEFHRKSASQNAKSAEWVPFPVEYKRGKPKKDNCDRVQLTVVVKVEKEIRLRIPLHTIGGIVCFGNVLCSPFLMGFCAKRDVAISFLTEYGRFLASVRGPVSGNVLLRREQYRRADDMNASAEMAGAILTGKLANCRTVLGRALRDHSDKLNTDEVREASQRINSSLQHLQSDLPLNVLRGFEGEAAHTYFSVFDHLITSQKKDFIFRQRNRRPPLDKVNCLLSFLYTIVLHDVRSALESVGLDPAVGFFTQRSSWPTRTGP